MSLGIVFALCGAVVLALADAYKKRLAESFSNAIVIWNAVAWAVVSGGAYLAVVGIGAVDWSVVLGFLPLSIALFIVGEVTFIRSLQGGEFSEVIPFKAAGPVTALFVSYLLLQEIPSWSALGGVALVVLGIYLMYLPNFSLRSILHPFQACWTQPGPRYMVISAALGAMLGITVKAASTGCSPLFYFWLILVGELLWFSVQLWWRGERPWIMYERSARETLIMGIPWGIGIILMNISVSYTFVAYALAVGQIHAVASFILAYTLFGERDVGRRIVPSLIMVVGVLCIVLG